jgi:hypothetical protein
LREEVKGILQVTNESLNDKYLGLSSDVGKSKNGAFKYLKDRIWKRIQGWIELILSAGAKKCLLNLLYKLSRSLLCPVSSFLEAFVNISTQ